MPVMQITNSHASRANIVNSISSLLINFNKVCGQVLSRFAVDWEISFIC